MPKAKSGAATLIRRRTITAVLALVSTLALAGCSFSCSVGTDSSTAGDEVPGSRYGDEAKRLLEEQVGSPIASFDCPDRVKVESGGQFRCTLTTPDGAELGATVTMTDEDGGFDVKVDE